jgi:hypothetical protein
LWLLLAAERTLLRHHDGSIDVAGHFMKNN